MVPPSVFKKATISFLTSSTSCSLSSITLSTTLTKLGVYTFTATSVDFPEVSTDFELTVIPAPTYDDVYNGRYYQVGRGNIQFPYEVFFTPDTTTEA